MARNNGIVSAAVVLVGAGAAYLYRDQIGAFVKSLTTAAGSKSIDIFHSNPAGTIMPGTGGMTIADVMKSTGMTKADVQDNLLDLEIPGTGNTGRELIGIGYTWDQIMSILFDQSKTDLVNQISGGKK